MRAERVGSDTVLAQIVRMVGEAQRTRAPIQRLADAVSAWFVPAVVVVSIAAFVGWYRLGTGAASGARAAQCHRGADHRLSVRARARDADGHHGRHGPRRVGGRADQERRGARAARESRHARRRQDRHAHRRPAAADRRHGRRAVLRPRRDQVRGRTRAGERASARRRRRRGRPRARPQAVGGVRLSGAGRPRGLRQHRGHAPSSSAARSCCARTASTLAELERANGRACGRADAPPSSWPSTASSPARWSSTIRSSLRRPPTRFDSSTPRACAS